MSEPATALDERVLLLAPTRRDAITTAALLESAGISVELCPNFDVALRELGRGAAALIVPEEMSTGVHHARLTALLSTQPPWSDLPLLVLTYSGADSSAAGDAVRTLGNVTLLERPLRVTTLLSAVRTALRARQRQYQIRSYLAERIKTEADLRAADQRKDEFLATLGHELRNPLAPLVSGMHLLRLTDSQEPRVLRIMAVMDRQISYLVRLVDDLLEVSRITRGLLDVRHDPLDLVAVVRAALETSRPALEAAGHEVIVALPATPIPVIGDAVRLTQVFANLLTNAAKYTNTGGQIELSARQLADRAVVSVRDSGVGIAAANLQSVFEMFMQVDRSTRHAQGGLGIGLTLVRSLVAMHGGHVEARSAGLGQGSEFIVELPVLAEALVDDVTPKPLGGFPGHRILVVDDNRDAAETLGALLEALGATVTLAHNGIAALDAFDRSAPDVILLDIGMPEMNGYEVARRVRARANGTGVTLIALTGWGQEQDHRQSEAAGFDHHMVKPPDLDKLRQWLSDPQPRASARKA